MDKGADVVDLTTFALTDFAALLAHGPDSVGGDLIDFGTGDTLLLENRLAAGLDAGEFLF